MPIAAEASSASQQTIPGDIPRRLGRYEVLSELGRGAMGVVYKARDPVLDRMVAIKTISLELPKSERAEYEARFYQEARAAGRLNHPNIVTIYDIGRTERLAYMAMGFLEGEELRALLTPGSPLAVGKAIDIAVQAATGLASAHENRVIHRDIKPSNLMVVRDALVKIMDFGIARLHESEVKTMTGLIMGSPKYMSPEQVTGGCPDQRSDVFSLGVVLYEILAGTSPFTGDSIHAIMYQIIHFAPPLPSQINRKVPEMLDLIVAKALAKKLDERYANATEMAHDLRLCRDLLPHAPAEGERTQPSTPLNASVRTGGTVPLNLNIPENRDDVEEPAPQRKSYGVSKAFDSAEATQRLAVFTGKTPATAAAKKPSSPAMPSRNTLAQPRRRLAKSQWFWLAAIFVWAGGLLTLFLSR
ncbi:MAG: serine/threonine protein kinase [Betaproteobacteria bacterium]|nr:serine/threonine protein kinase [Betaproteobacteria bacterium]